MKKPLLSGILGIVIGLGIGAGVMRWFDSCSSVSGTKDNSKQPDRGQAFGSVTDPVCSALDPNKLFKGIMSPKKGSEYEYEEAGSGDNFRAGYAVWEAEPLDDKALRARVVAALNDAITSAGARPVSEKDFTVGSIAVGAHKLHYFTCPYFYRAKPGDQHERLGQANVWVTTPSEGKQFSAGFRFGQ